jgi:hypothetical protein
MNIQPIVTRRLSGSFYPETKDFSVRSAVLAINANIFHFIFYFYLLQPVSAAPSPQMQAKCLHSTSKHQADILHQL